MNLNEIRRYNWMNTFGILMLNWIKYFNLDVTTYKNPHNEELVNTIFDAIGYVYAIKNGSTIGPMNVLSDIPSLDDSKWVTNNFEYRLYKGIYNSETQKYDIKFNIDKKQAQIAEYYLKWDSYIDENKCPYITKIFTDKISNTQYESKMDTEAFINIFFKKEIIVLW